MKIHEAPYVLVAIITLTGAFCFGASIVTLSDMAKERAVISATLEQPIALLINYRVRNI